MLHYASTGFHIARATEALIQEYWTAETGKPLPAKGARTWVRLVQTMLDKKIGDESFLESTRFVGSSYRNPLIHPEYSLDETDGPLLLAACTGTMTKLLAQLPKPVV